jgi:hypothetical protein
MRRVVAPVPVAPICAVPGLIGGPAYRLAASEPDRDSASRLPLAGMELPVPCMGLRRGPRGRRAALAVDRTRRLKADMERYGP